MPNYDWECKNEHVFEQITPYDQDSVRCPKCKSKASRVWMAPRSPHRQLQTPIVLWKYADGTLGVAGGADSQTPPNAERVEVRTAGEYRRYSKELNNQLREKEARREEKYRESREAIEHHFRSDLAYKMGQESDPIAREIYREALERHKGGFSSTSFKEFFSVAMENDRSNYE